MVNLQSKCRCGYIKYVSCHVVHSVYIIDTSIEVAVLPLVPHAP